MTGSRLTVLGHNITPTEAQVGYAGPKYYVNVAFAYVTVLLKSLQQAI